jgi:hypothetical protein
MRRGGTKLWRTGIVVLAITLANLCSVASTSAHSSGKYGGLGAKVAAFYASNPRGSGTPPLGVAYYHVDQTRGGRVIAYHVQINAKPPFSNRERIAGLLDGINLPLDARTTRINRNTCIVWRSATLKRLIGMAYAAGTTQTGTTTAKMRAERTPHC